MIVPKPKIGYLLKVRKIKKAIPNISKSLFHTLYLVFNLSYVTDYFLIQTPIFTRTTARFRFK
jgi:hypothetical protein